MTNYFTKYTIEQADNTSTTAYVRDTEAVHKEDFKHLSPYVRLTTADLMKDPGGDSLVPYIIQAWNPNTIRTKVDADKEIKLYNLDNTIFKDSASKKVTLQFVVYIPDNYTATITDLKGTTIRGKDLHGFTITDNNSKNSHYRVQQSGFGSFDTININLWSLGTAVTHNSVKYDRAVIINVKATMGVDGDGKDALGIRFWVNNEDVSKMDTLPWFIISEAGTHDPTNTLVQDNDKYSKSEIDAELALKADVGDSYTKSESDNKYLTDITNEKLESLKNVPTPTVSDDKKYLQYDHGNDEFKYATVSAGSSKLTDLTDTDIYNLGKNQQLIYNGSKWNSVFTYPTQFRAGSFNIEVGFFYIASNTQATDRDLNLPNKANLNRDDTVYIMITSDSANGKTYTIKSDANQIWPGGGGGTKTRTIPKTDWGQVWEFKYDKSGDYWGVTSVFDWTSLPRTVNSLSNVTIDTANINTDDALVWDGSKWINKAVTGTKGDKGDTGAQGPTGPRGPQGVQGPKGDKGDTGAKGDTGSQGVQGPRGLQGQKGDKGEKGDTGNTGPAGIQGTRGDKGDKGDTGPQGPQGIQGPQGPAATAAKLTSSYTKPKEFFWGRSTAFSVDSSQVDKRIAANWFDKSIAVKTNTIGATFDTSGKISSVPVGNYKLMIDLQFLDVDGFQLFVKVGGTEQTTLKPNKAANNLGTVTADVSFECEFDITGSAQDIEIEYVVDDPDRVGFRPAISASKNFDPNQPWITVRLVELMDNTFTGVKGDKGEKGDSGGTDPDKLVVGVLVTKLAVPSFASNTWQEMKLFGGANDSVFGMSTIDTSNNYLLGYKGTSITRKDDNTLTLKPGTYQIWMNTGRSGSHGHYIGYKATNSDIPTTARNYLYSVEVNGNRAVKSERLVPGDIEILEIRGGSSSTNIEHTSTITVSGGDSDFTMWFRGNSNYGNAGSLSIVKIG